MQITMNIEGLLARAAKRTHVGGVNFTMGDGSVRFGHDLPDIAAAVARAHPKGLDAIVIGQAPQAGWSPATDFQSNGIIAILIGLLLPAVQALRDSARRIQPASGQPPLGLATLQQTLKPGARIYVLGADGKLLPCP